MSALGVFLVVLACVPVENVLSRPWGGPNQLDVSSCQDDRDLLAAVSFALCRPRM